MLLLLPLLLRLQLSLLMLLVLWQPLLRIPFLVRGGGRGDSEDDDGGDADAVVHRMVVAVTDVAKLVLLVIISDG